MPEIMPSQLRAFDFYDSSLNESHPSHLSFQRLFRRSRKKSPSSEFFFSMSNCFIRFRWERGCMYLLVGSWTNALSHITNNKGDCTLYIVEEFIAFNLVKNQRRFAILCTILMSRLMRENSKDLFNIFHRHVSSRSCDLMKISKK